jgi:hypothetical protein
MPRQLLNIASVVCLVLCVALMGMWVRSYHWSDELHGRLTRRQVFIATSVSGRLLLTSERLDLNRMRGFPGDYWPWTVKTHPNDDRMGPKIPRSSGGLFDSWGFAALSLSWASSDLIVPYWFPVLTSGLMGMIFRLRWPLRFTLRSLFIVTTFLAVVLGMMAWLDRAWIGK